MGICRGLPSLSTTKTLPPGVPSLPQNELTQWCCNGSISIRAHERNQWQPLSWGTELHRDFYRWGRARIENTNGIVKHDGGMDSRACPAPGIRAHSMTLLALAVANNVTRADADVCADPPATDVPVAEASLFCGTPALHTNGRSNGTSNGSSNGTTPSGRQTVLSGRAPP